MLSRVPAVKWAITRLRPARIEAADAAPTATETASTAVVDDADMPSAGSVVEAGISAEPILNVSPIVEPAVAESTTVVDVADTAPADAAEATDDSPCCVLADIAPVDVDESVPGSVDTVNERDALQDVVDAEPSHVTSAEIAPIEAAAATIDDVAEDLPETAQDISERDAPSHTLEDTQPVADEIVQAAAAECAESLAEDDTEACSNDAEIEAVETAPPIITEAAEAPIAEASEASPVETSAEAADEAIEAPVGPAPDIREAPKTPVRAADPADRATLIRQRWAETGIRMWNPRLHGTGDAALNIQGRIELLPPAPGEKMPRYDKLEFRLLGGQIVCEGVIVEAPVHAGQRSFTKLAERRQPDRAREAVPA